MYLCYSQWAVDEGRETAILISMRYKHRGVEIDDSAMTTLDS
jgi:hypothetical protein